MPKNLSQNTLVLASTGNVFLSNFDATGTTLTDLANNLVCTGTALSVNGLFNKAKQFLTTSDYMSIVYNSILNIPTGQVDVYINPVNVNTSGTILWKNEEFGLEIISGKIKGSIHNGYDYHTSITTGSLIPNVYSKLSMQWNDRGLINLFVNGSLNNVPVTFNPAIFFPITGTAGSAGSTELDTIYNAVGTLSGTTIAKQVSSDLGGGEILFTSANAYFSVPDSNNYYSTGRITFECSFKCSTLGVDQALITQYNSTDSPTKGYDIYINTNNDIVFNFYNGAGQLLGGFFETTSILNTTSYFHLVLTLDLTANTIKALLVKKGVSSHILVETINTGGSYQSLSVFASISNSANTLNFGGYEDFAVRLRGVMKNMGLYIEDNIIDTHDKMLLRAVSLGF